MQPTSSLTGPQVALRAISSLRTLVYSVVLAKWTGLLWGFGRQDVCNLKFMVASQSSHCSSEIYFGMEELYNNCHYIHQCLPVDALQDFTFKYFLINTLFDHVSYSIFTGSFAFFCLVMVKSSIQMLTASLIVAFLIQHWSCEA